jgi:hypothetical protein
VLKAQERRLRLQQMKGELVDRAKAVAQVFRLARDERDAWVNWPARVAAVIAAELGVDPHQLHPAPTGCGSKLCARAAGRRDQPSPLRHRHAAREPSALILGGLAELTSRHLR